MSVPLTTPIVKSYSYSHGHWDLSLRS